MHRPIYALEPFFGGSHKQFLDGLTENIEAEIQVLPMSPHHWKWRMHGSALYYADLIKERQLSPGSLFASDFVNLSALRGFFDRPDRWTLLMYFHENQLTYPFRKPKERDLTYGHINIQSALSADWVYFNSEFHRRDFLNAIPKFYARFVDYIPDNVPERIRDQSSVLPLGLHLQRFDAVSIGEKKPAVGTILWNQRWEHDKNPKLFFETLFRLRQEDVPFRLIVCGERFENYPEIFNKTKQQLQDRIDHWGYAEHWEDYARLLHQADIVVSTAKHEFFGISILEAMYCSNYPILPDRLVYPEYIPESSSKRNLYRGPTQLYRKLREALNDIAVTRQVNFRHVAARFDWKSIGPEWEKELKRWQNSRS